ncbi:Secreted RxLR effector peptide protein [Phytophthora palmivora]|uniref:Secreted RxLR effector peptide protein n=1 Tax=Phytophthora palmivora TaxID=4796 RepID=A0A2P4YKC1_9STRA|nr:Secreted RxLR effector peptide protein [Phytophthora palmivora]
MRANFVLLITTIALLAATNVMSSDVGARELRSLDKSETQDEERANYQFKFNWWDDIFHRLPKQFQRMRTQPAYLDHILESWRQGWVALDQAVAFMKKEGLTTKAIRQFKAAYVQYIEKHPFLPPNRPEV